MKILQGMQIMQAAGFFGAGLRAIAARMTGRGLFISPPQFLQ
ncbi:MAG: hypothetical protein OD918_02965 [Gammaproteobacteria bacterium]